VSRDAIISVLGDTKFSALSNASEAVAFDSEAAGDRNWESYDRRPSCAHRFRQSGAAASAALRPNSAWTRARFAIDCGDCARGLLTDARTSKNPAPPLLRSLRIGWNSKRHRRVVRRAFALCMICWFVCTDLPAATSLFCAMYGAVDRRRRCVLCAVSRHGLGSRRRSIGCRAGRRLSAVGRDCLVAFEAGNTACRSDMSALRSTFAAAPEQWRFTGGATVSPPFRVTPIAGFWSISLTMTVLPTRGSSPRRPWAGWRANSSCHGAGRRRGSRRRAPISLVISAPWRPCHEPRTQDNRT